MKEVVDMTPEEYKKFIFQSGVTRSDLGGEIIKMNAGGGSSFVPRKWITNPSSMCYGQYVMSGSVMKPALVGGCIKGNVILTGYKETLPMQGLGGVTYPKEFLYYGKIAYGKKLYLSGDSVVPHADRPAGGGGNFSGADAGIPYRWQVLSDAHVMRLNQAGVPMIPQQIIKAGQIIEGKQRMISTKSMTGNVWTKRMVIEIGNNKYVKRDQVIEYVPKPTGEKGNFSGAEELSISNIKNSISDIAKTESVQVGAGVGALIGLGVSFLLGTSKIGTTVAGAVVFGWMGYEADSQAEKQIQSKLFTETGKK